MNDVQIKIKMRIISIYVVLTLTLCASHCVFGQERFQEKIEFLQEQKTKITAQEKEALKKEVEEINRKFEKGQITEVEARQFKETVAKKRALNIENRMSIIDNKIALLERNEGDILQVNKNFSFTDKDNKVSIVINDEKWHLYDKREPKYDRRTYNNLVLGFGLNNALVEGQSIEDTPYKIGGSRFFEVGWAWRTRVFKNANFLRFSYGASFQFNGLKPKDNQYFVFNEGQVELQEFEYELKKSKFRMNNLVFPVHLEFGPSKFRKGENTIRYSIRNKFRVGLGGYGGFNLGTRQKLKYRKDGERVKDKLKGGYDTTNFIYGLSGYVGFGDLLLYAKYDLNPIFKNAIIQQNNISLGVRVTL